MDLHISEFDILLCFAGVKTKEGQDFVECIEWIGPGGPPRFTIFRVSLENGSILEGNYMSTFTFNPSYSKTFILERFYNDNPSFIAGSPGYWKEFRKVVKDVASFYVF